MYLSRPAAIGVLVVLLGLAYIYVARPVSLPFLLVLLAIAGSPLLAAYIYVNEPANVPISHRAAGWLLVFTVVVAIATYLWLVQPASLGPAFAG